MQSRPRTALAPNLGQDHRERVGRRRGPTQASCRATRPTWRATAMISRARAEASRNNGRKSRGPRTAAGRSCASHNALRHGLAALTYKRAAFAEVERIAKAICNGNTDPLLFDQALVIAENEMVRRCVRVEAIALIERLRDITVNPLSRDNSLTRAKARFGQARLRYRQLVRARAFPGGIESGGFPSAFA